VSLGLQHGGGPKAILLLRDRGHPLPRGWRVLGDNSRRGLVLSVPDEVADDDTLTWLLRAAALLTTPALPDGWRAGVNRTS
jgi:hypothetical protein